MRNNQIVKLNTTEAFQDDFDKGYVSTLQLIQEGQYDLAAKSEYIIAQTPATQNHLILKTLLTYRISLKANSITLDGKNYLNFLNIHDKKILAEIHLINGNYFTNCKLHKEAHDSFSKASELYSEIKWNDKYLVASYNQLISESNLHDGPITVHQYNKLIQLQNEAELFNNRKVLGLLSRQKSYFFKENFKWNAALSEAERSSTLLESVGFRSDYHFALLNLADCYLELNQVQNAKSAFEKIIPPIDSRVQFAYYFIESLINSTFNSNKMDELSPSKDADIHFLSRAQFILQQQNNPIRELSIHSENEYTWNKNKDLMSNGKTNWEIKKGSKEFIIISLLLEGAKSPEYLKKVLWPFFAENDQIENRLHSLISKINRKSSGLIKRVDGKYVLTKKITVE